MNTKDSERKILSELTGLLVKNSEKVLEGETKVCLTTTSLEILVSNFRRYSEKEDGGREETSSSREQKKRAAELKKWQETIRTLIDFVLKIKALKIINTNHTMKAPIQIARFSSLQVLEVKKIPIHMLEGLSKLRGQLKELNVSRSLADLQGLLEVCGGDRASGLVWSLLSTALLGFNGLEKLDNSLRLVPFLEVLDLSHNSLKETGDFLMTLTDVARISLGYNLLSSVPKISMANKMKLRTLVLRNNSLDNLEGVEDMLVLEELDVSENCLLDHKTLHVLSGLNRLQVLSLTGNPLFYKPNHRSLTLKKLSPQTAMASIMVDGLRLSPYEISIVRQNHYLKRPSAVDIRVQDNADGMETIVVSHGRGGSSGHTLHPNHEKNKRRGHKRIHSKERIPTIGNIQDSMDDEYASDASPNLSYSEETDVNAELEKDKMRIEILREHYKEDWLKALSAEQGHYNQKPLVAGDNVAKDAAKGTDKSREKEVGSISVNGKDVGKIVEKAGIQSAENKKITVDGDGSNKTPKTPTNHTDMQGRPVCEPTVESTPFSPTAEKPYLHIVDTTDIYARVASARMESVEAPTEVLQERVEAEAMTDIEEHYGTESEPLIVMLPDRAMKQIFITVNNRYILEKDTDGKRLASLDLKCLQSIQKTEQDLSGQDIVGSVRFTVMTLDFDYVKKDMRQRKYAMEDNNDALIMESLIYPHLKAKEEKGIEQLECLRCKHKFSQQSSGAVKLMSCPSCRSKMVIKVDSAGHELGASTTDLKAEVTHSLQAEPQRIERETTVRLRSSPSLQRKRMSPHRLKDTETTSDTESSQRMQSSTFEGSLSDFVDKLIPDEEGDEKEKRKRKGFYKNTEEGSQADGMEKSASSSDSNVEALMKPNTSWSDVPRSANSQSMTRSSVSSVDSDITVLTTNSKGSVSVISESSHEVTYSEQFLCGSKTGGPSGTDVAEFYEQSSGRRGNENAESDSLVGKSARVLVTPVGSPLSNSVCSSMVSSVYENTLSAGGDDRLSVTGDSHNNTGDTGSLTGSSSDSVALRHSLDATDTRSRRSKHRNATVYLDETDSRSHASDSKFGANNSREISGETTKYYTSQSHQEGLSSLNSTRVSTEKSFSSIYDQVAADSDSEKPDDVDSSFHSTIRRSHDQLTVSSDHSSPRKRSGNRSRSRSSNRSAVYGDSMLEQSGDSQDVSGLPEFPSDLSPIKRVPNQQSANQETADSEISHSELAEGSEILRDKGDKSASVTNGSDTTGNSEVLPWDKEQIEKDKAAKHESLIHDEFINIDHRIQLYLELNVLKAEEQIQCAIECNIVQYMMPKEIKSLLVISATRILIFRIEGELESNSSDWLTCYEDQPITELQYVDVGLGYQSLRLEFSTECSSFTLLICDEARCKQFLTLLSDIVQTTAIHEHSKLEGISKSNPTTMDNLQYEVLQGGKGDEEEEEEMEGSQQLVRYLLVKYMTPDNEDDEGKILGLVVTATHLILVQENHQWPLPRLQAPLSGDTKGQQFTVLQREKINNLETFVFNEYDPRELRLSFFENSDAGAASVWYITMETTKGVKSLVDAIREPWEEEFGVSLDVTSQSFTED